MTATLKLTEGSTAFSSFDRTMLLISSTTIGADVHNCLRGHLRSPLWIGRIHTRQTSALGWAFEATLTDRNTGDKRGYVRGQVVCTLESYLGARLKETPATARRSFDRLFQEAHA